MRMRPIYVRIGGPRGLVMTFRGRLAWALLQLITAGEKGVTPIDNPGPRWSGYVFDLRQAGIVIETIDEKHGGPFPGSHARYVLRSQVDVLTDSEASNAEPLTGAA